MIPTTPRTTHRATRRTFGALVLLALTALACSDKESAAPATVAPAAPPAPVTVDPARADLVFRYLDPERGEVATAASLDAIPAAARREVVVYDPTVSLPAGWDLVADLSVTPAVATPRQHFAFATRAALTPSTAAPPATATRAAGSHEVVLFSTQGCGYCDKARRFLTQHRVPFTELDVEDDPAAPGRLTALGQRAGLGPRDLQGVPIIFVDGQPILGWDQKRLAKLLGIGG